MPRKRGEGTSCHHCKKRTPLSDMIKCTSDGDFKSPLSRKRRRSCVKKYCLHCIKTFYHPQYLVENETGNFICPSCKDECRCAACRRRTMKMKLHADGTKLRAMQTSSMVNPILESEAGPDATKIEEEQVNSLLEILESRPDVQDIIRKGMSLDFADDNAKILYIAHLIDQALSRPDILALYYAHTTGKASLRTIKGEYDEEDDVIDETGLSGMDGLEPKGKFNGIDSQMNLNENGILNDGTGIPPDLPPRVMMNGTGMNPALAGQQPVGGMMMGPPTLPGVGNGGPALGGGVPGHFSFPIPMDATTTTGSANVNDGNGPGSADLGHPRVMKHDESPNNDPSPSFIHS